MNVLLRIAVMVILLTLLPDLYILRSYATRWGRRAKGLFALPSVLLWLSLIALLLTHDFQQEAMSRMSLYVLVLVCISVPKLLFVIVSALLRVGRWFTHRSRSIEVTGGCVVAFAALGYLIYCAAEGVEHYTIRRVTISSPRIPKAFDGYRIVQFSDFHAGSWNANGRAVKRGVDSILAQRPDVILFTGDLVNNLATEVDPFIRILSQLQAPDGVYSVLGNHDYSLYIPWERESDRLGNLQSLKDKQAEMGWRLLNNEHTILRRGGDSIALAGVENSGNPPFPNVSDLPRALQGTQGMFTILMSHDPTHWRREVLPQSEVDLMLAGHTHDMQIRLFGFSPSRFVYPEHDGLYAEDGQRLFVNIGVGHLLFPMRIGAWPEITVFTLKSSK
jgi:predicted MPP superfamily phosphohydrolase